MFCPNCGTNIADNAKFCPKCGASINSSAPDRDGRREIKKPTAGNSTLGTSKTSQQGAQSTLEDQVVSTRSKFREKLTPRIIGIIVAAVVVIAAIIVLIVVLNNRSSTSDYGSDNDLPKTGEEYEDPTETATENESTFNPDDTEENEDYENTEIQQLRSTLLEEKESFPVPDGRRIKKASKYRIDGSLASETEYYENGTVSHVIEYDVDGYKDTEIKYNESGEITEEHDYLYIPNDNYFGSATIGDHIIYEYGDYGIISKEKFGRVGNSENGDVLTLTDEKTGESYNIRFSEGELYLYDEKGNLIQVVFESSPYGDAAFIDEMDEYTYDENNNLLEYHVIKDWSSIEDRTESTPWEFTYDENNNMITAKIYSTVPSYDFVYYVYTYDDDNLVSIKTYNADDMSLRDWEEYIYNDNNLLVQRNCYDSKDALTSSDEYTYSFDEEGQKLSVIMNSATLIEEYAYWDDGSLLLSYEFNGTSIENSPYSNRNYLETLNDSDKYKSDSESSYTIYWDNGNVAMKGNSDNDSYPELKYDYFGNVTYDASDTSEIYTYEYTYDDSGNVLTESVLIESSREGKTKSDYTYVNEYFDS